MIGTDANGDLTITVGMMSYGESRDLAVGLLNLMVSAGNNISAEGVWCSCRLVEALLPSEEEYKEMQKVAACRKSVV